MVSEFFREFGPDVAITVTPEVGGRFEVLYNGEKLFDKKAMGNIYPSLTHYRQMRDTIKERQKAPTAES
jgi:predicted Rdx family selenoprotein